MRPKPEHDFGGKVIDAAVDFVLDKAVHHPDTDLKEKLLIEAVDDYRTRQGWTVADIHGVQEALREMMEEKPR